MHKLLKKSFKVIVRIGVLCIILLLALVSCVTFRKSDKSTLKKLTHLKQASIQYDFIKNRTIRYVYTDKDSSKTTLILVHGAPGSSSAFLDYLEDTSITNQFNIVSIDRQGYGFSNYGKYTTIKEQAEILSQLTLQLVPNGNVYLVGHSYGGPIVAKAAIELKNSIKGSILLAPALDPENEKMFWFSKLGYWGSTKWMTSKALQVASSEKIMHSEELAQLEGEWKKLNTPLYHIHGTSDKIVPFVNLEFSKTHFNPEILTTKAWEGKGHLIPFTEMDMVMEEIKQFIAMHNNS